MKIINKLIRSLYKRTNKEEWLKLHKKTPWIVKLSEYMPIHCLGNGDKVRQEFDYVAKTDLLDGLKEIIEYQKNYKG